MQVGDAIDLMVKHLETPFGEAELLPHGATEQAKQMHVWNELQAVR